MFELILIYKTKQVEIIFPTKEEALSYLKEGNIKQPRFSFILGDNDKIKHFERR